MALTIDPEDVPSRKFLVIEDPDTDRWMCPGEITVENSDGSSASYALDDGSGGAFRIGTSLGFLYFRLDLTAGIVTGVTGPTVAGAVPADTATEIYFDVAELASTTAADFTQIREGPLRWQNSGAPSKWGGEPLIFTADDGLGGRAEIARIYFDRGRPLIPAGGLDVQVDSAGTSWPSSYAATVGGGSMASQTFNFEDHTGNIRTYRGATDANLLLIHDVAWGFSSVIEEDTGETVLSRQSGDDVTTAAGSYEASVYGEDEYNGSAAWSASFA
jgi:hypothetical protein